jgi:hypothetical protein
MTTQESLPHVWISFTLIGDSFDPDAATAALGVSPTSCHRKGDQRGETARWQKARWRVTVGPRDTIEVGAMLGELMAYMPSNGQEIRQVCAELELEATVTCAVEPTSSLTPVIRFSPEVVRWAADGDVAIDIDIMIWRDDEQHES